MFRNGWQVWAGICTGWIQDEIGKVVGMSRGSITQIVNNTNFGEINNLHSHGHDVEYIARHYNMDLPLAWALRLEGKTDQERFKEVENGWGPDPSAVFNPPDFLRMLTFHYYSMPILLN
jgi:hypothetical protein